MFTFKSLLTSSAILLSISAQVSAHALFAPALGVSGAGVRNDVQRPSTAKPCGNAALSTIDTSTAVAAKNGLVTLTVTDFNAGADGSRAIASALVDTTGKGTSFVAAKITTNGDANPTAVGSQSVSITLPAGTTCKGGATGNKCLVSLKTTANFGNCVVVTTGAASAAPATGATAGAAGAKGAVVAASSAVLQGTTTTVAATSTGATRAGTHQHHGGASAQAAKAKSAAVVDCKANTRRQARNARALVDSVGNNLHVARSWVWAA